MSITYKIVAVKFTNTVSDDVMKTFFEQNNKLRFKAKYIEKTPIVTIVHQKKNRIPEEKCIEQEFTYTEGDQSIQYLLVVDKTQNSLEIQKKKQRGGGDRGRCKIDEDGQKIPRMKTQKKPSGCILCSENCSHQTVQE